MLFKYTVWGNVVPYQYLKQSALQIGIIKLCGKASEAEIAVSWRPKHLTSEFCWWCSWADKSQSEAGGPTKAWIKDSVQESQKKYILYKAEDAMQNKAERGFQSKGQFIEHLLVGLFCG